MKRGGSAAAQQREASLKNLARSDFDLLVIGGGITGAGIARDAALRGLRVALVEKRDFAAGTSSRSSKLVHGGVRYLQQGDVALVMEAVHERRVLRSLIPHLVSPHELLFPVHSRSGYVKLRAGLWTFDRMARAARAEQHQMLSREEVLGREPQLRAERLYGAAMYVENVSDDARLVIENLKSAIASGAVIANYAGVTSLLQEGQRLGGAFVEDAFSGASFPVRARAVINAAGPWVDSVRAMHGSGEGPRLHLTKGVHLVLRRDRLDVSHLVCMPAADRRTVFVVPREQVVYVGTTDTDYVGDYAEPSISRDDTDYLLDAVNAAFDVEPLTREDVVGAWAGLRPLLHQDGKKPSEISRKDEIMIGPTGLISIAGGKLTTYRKMAERVVELACTHLAENGSSSPPRVGASETEPLSGGGTGADVDAFTKQLQTDFPDVEGKIVARLVTVYGSNARNILKIGEKDMPLGRPCAPGSTVTRAEVMYAVREEMAMTLGDFLERRARVFLWSPDNGLPVAAPVATVMGELLGWTNAERAAEIAAYERHVSEVKSFPAGAECARSQVAHG